MLLRVPAVDGVVVPLVEEQPLVLPSTGAAPAPAVGADEDEPAGQLLAEEVEVELAGLHRGQRILLVPGRRPSAHGPRR